MDLHHSFYDIYSQYLFDNFECFNVCVIDQNITKHFQGLANFAELRDDHSVLDMGCGNGQFLNFLDKKFNNIQTLGVDPSKKQIAIAHSHTNGPSYQNDNCATFNPTQKYDRIFFNESIGYNKDSQYELLHRYQTMLNPGGLLVISTLMKQTPFLVSILIKSIEIISKFLNNKVMDYKCYLLFRASSSIKEWILIILKIILNILYSRGLKQFKKNG